MINYYDPANLKIKVIRTRYEDEFERKVSECIDIGGLKFQVLHACQILEITMLQLRMQQS